MGFAQGGAAPASSGSRTFTCPSRIRLDLAGIAAMGRWHYSPWFWPPYIPTLPPIPNPYYDPINAPWEPPTIPGTPNPSSRPRTSWTRRLVNGTAYPYLDVAAASPTASGS